MKSRLLMLAIAGLPATFSSSAHAQTETLLVQPSLPYDFDRGRNVSVLQRGRPDYDALGIRAGSFLIYPEVTMAARYSNNLYYTDTNKIDDGAVTVAPSVTVKSDWSRNQLQINGGVQLQRYFQETLRNQTPFNLGTQATLQIGNSVQIIPQLQFYRQYETPFTGETSSDSAILSHYSRKYGAIRAEYGSGQTKLTFSVDDNIYKFSDIRSKSLAIIDQSDRDRNIARVTAQGQYAFTPSLSSYLQLEYANTDYDRTLLNGQPNRDAQGIRAIGGFNFDLASLLRGTIGLGYTHRNFRSGLYPSVGGFSAEGRLEYFPSELTTLTLAVRRVIEDSSLGGSRAFFDNRASVRVDHELRANLLVKATGEIIRQNYIGTTDKANAYNLGAGAVYLSSRRLALKMDMNYSDRTRNGAAAGQKFNEFNATLGVTLKQ